MYFRVDGTGHDSEVLKIRRLEQFREAHGRLPVLNTDGDTVRALDPMFDLGIRGAIGAEPLDNYDGWIVTNVSEGENRVQQDDEGRYLVSAGSELRLQIFLNKQRPETGSAEKLTIDSGEDGGVATFQVLVDADHLVTTPQELSLDSGSGAGASCSFVVKVPPEPGEYEVFLQVSQKGRLCQVQLISVLADRES